MTRPLLFCCLLALPTLGLFPSHLQGQAETWWRGNLHTHSLWSDGDDYPEMIADWYKAQGYHFLAFSDHDILQEGQRWLSIQGGISFAGNVTHRGGGEVLEKYLRRFGPQWVEQRRVDGRHEVRLKPLSEFRTLFEEPGQFLLIPGIEVSHWEVVAADGTKKPATVHLNAINVRDAGPKPSGQTVLELLQRSVDAVLAQRERTGQAMFPHVNHPNFRWGITPDDLMRVRGLRFFEVYNGHPQVNNEGDADHPSTERLWDLALTHRLTDLGLGILYGIATDDSHHYHEKAADRSNSGRGWVMVRSSHLTPEFLIRAMEAGDFYSSSGVALADVIMLCRGLALLKLLPTFLFAALVVNTSCLFLVDEIVFAYRKFRRREFALVLLHVVIAAAYGMLEAIIAGLLLTGMIFVVEYSRPVHSGVQSTSTVGQERSRVVRSAAEVELLERASSSRTLIIHLRGDLFFGSIPHVVEVLRRWDDLIGSDAPKEDGAHTAMSATDVESKGGKGEPLAVSGDLTRSLSASEPRMVLFDCSFCTGIDSSAAASLAEAIGAMNPEVQAMFACACEDVLVPMTKACRGRAKMTSHSTLDLALERCEELLLKGQAISPNSSPTAQRPRGHGFTPHDEADGRGELCTMPSAEKTTSGRAATLDTALMSDQLVDDSSRSTFVVFTPDDSRYNPEERQRAFARLESLCVRVHGVVGMAEFVRMMDIVLTPPFTALNFVKEQSPLEGNPAKDCHAIEPFSILRTSAPPVDAYVYVLLSGYVTEKLIQRSNSRGERQRADRVAKLRPGAVLGAASFETFLMESRQQHHSQRLWSKVSLHLSVVGVTDTFCLLARFPASRYARMESENPAMALKLMRLIARSSLDRLGDMMNEAVATDRFRTGVSPTSKHEGLERWLPAPTNTVEVGSPSFAAANDPCDPPTCDIDGRPCDARAIAGPIARTRSSPQCNRRCELPSLSVGAEAPMSAMDDVSMKHVRPRESSELQPSRSLDTLRHADSNYPSSVPLPQAVPKRLPTASCSAQAFSTRAGARSRASRPVPHFLRLPEEGDGSSSDEEGHEFANAAAQGGVRSFFRLPDRNV